MNLKRHILCLLSAIALSAGLKAADNQDGKSETLRLPSDQTAILFPVPIPDLGEGHLEDILTDYYVMGLGGSENWEKISSLKMTGTVELKSGKFELNVLQRKPDLIKMTMRKNQNTLVMAYDGESAWLKEAGSGAEAKLMNPSEARHFVNSTKFGSHLLYPFASGKTIKFIDTVPVEGHICHQIRVTLDTGYQVDYFIDIRSFLEIKVVNTDLENGSVNSAVYKDYIREAGMPIAKHVEGFENGEWVNTMTIDEVKINSGVIPWMFEMRTN